MVERYLPGDIVFDILIWLPVKSLIRFTCVSKKWRCKILYDPEFAKSQFRASKNLSRHSRLFLYTAPQLFKLSLDLQSTLRGETTPRGEITLLGSSNGLVFLKVQFYHQGIHILIYNPLTGFFKKLPDPDFDHENDIGYGVNYFGVGYLSATDDYKILINHHNPFRFGRDYEGPKLTKLYSLRANLLKRIEVNFEVDNTYWEYFDVGARYRLRRGTYLNESLHWIGHNSDDRYMILAFDLDKEKFRRMQLPDYFENIKYDVYREEVGTLEVSSGDLCISSYPKDNFEDPIHLWVMREYGLPGSWTKLTLSCPNRHTILRRPYLDILVMDSSTVVVNYNYTRQGTEFTMIEHKEKTEFTMIEHKEEGKIALYTINEDTDYEVIDYEESLVWIDHYHRSQEDSQSSFN